MMLQPGDKVWMKGELDRIDSDGFVELGHWWNHDVKYLIPDVPNLPAIARYLADHPEMVDALDLVIQAANAMEEFIPASLPDRRDAPGIVSEFLKAMRGEGGHE